MKLNVKLIPPAPELVEKCKKQKTSLVSLPLGTLCKLKGQSPMVLTMTINPNYAYCIFLPMPGYPKDGPPLPDNNGNIAAGTLVEEVFGTLEFTAEEG